MYACTRICICYVLRICNAEQETTSVQAAERAHFHETSTAISVLREYLQN